MIYSSEPTPGQSYVVGRYFVFKETQKTHSIEHLPVKVREPLKGAKGVGALQYGSGIKSHQGPAVAV